MRYSALLTNTSKSHPRSVRGRGNELLHRAGYVRPVSQGLYSFLPLGTRVIERISALIRSQMEGLGGQEVQLPLVNPIDVWKRSARDRLMDDDMVRFSDISGRTMVLAPTHEEVMVELVKSVVTSYRQLPVFLYQFQTKFRNEKRPRGGLIRTREFVMKDGYSFHRSTSELNNFFPRVFAAYERIFAACNVPFVTAEAAVGSMLGDRSLEFLMPTEVGDDAVVSCGNCGYAANQEVAVGTVPTASESPRPLQTARTGGAVTMEELAEALSRERRQLAKTMLYSTGETVVLAIVRGDQEVSPEKLAQTVGVPLVRKASAEELATAGIDPRIVSPIEYSSGHASGGMRVVIVVDEVVANTPNLVLASNRPGSHFIDVNFGRDFGSDVVADIARVLPGSRCRICGGELEGRTVIELGNIFKLGDYYSRRLRLALPDGKGGRFYPQMGAYGIGLGRLMAATAEANNDRRGLAWPVAIAPYRSFLMGIGRSAKVARVGAMLHDELGPDTLYDDRRESISEKFKDADLLGIPFRLIISPRTVEQGKVEVLERGSRSMRRVDIGCVAAKLASLVKERG